MIVGFGYQVLFSSPSLASLVQSTGTSLFDLGYDSKLSQNKYSGMLTLADDVEFWICLVSKCIHREGEINQFFVTVFGSAMIFGIIVGSLANKQGGYRFHIQVFADVLHVHSIINFSSPRSSSKLEDEVLYLSGDSGFMEQRVIALIWIIFGLCLCILCSSFEDASVMNSSSLMLSFVELYVAPKASHVGDIQKITFGSLPRPPESYSVFVSWHNFINLLNKAVCIKEIESDHECFHCFTRSSPSVSSSVSREGELLHAQLKCIQDCGMGTLLISKIREE